MKGQVPVWGQAPLRADLRAQGSPPQPSGPGPRSSRWEGPRARLRRPLGAEQTLAHGAQQAAGSQDHGLQTDCPFR